MISRRKNVCVNTVNFYTIYRLSNGAYAFSDGIDKGEFSGNIRIDPAPRWNRTNDAILIPGIDENRTRQMFMIRLIPTLNHRFNRW